MSLLFNLLGVFERIWKGTYPLLPSQLLLLAGMTNREIVAPEPSPPGRPSIDRSDAESGVHEAHLLTQSRRVFSGCSCIEWRGEIVPPSAKVFAPLFTSVSQYSDEMI